MTPVKKKKRKAEIEKVFDAKEQRKAERRLANHIMELDERSMEREKYVIKILSVNDEGVEEVVSSMVANLRKMQGPPKLVFEGQTFQAVKGETELLEHIQTRNFRYLATRILVACAEWGIRVGEFKLPKGDCARCGRRVK